MKRRITKQIEKLVIETYKQKGEHLLSVALKFNISQTSVYKILRRNNIKRKPNGINQTVSNSNNLRKGRHYLTILQISILDYWDNGKNTITISRKLGISRLKVALTITKHRKYNQRLVKMVKAVIRSGVYTYNEVRYLALYLKIKGRCEICGRSRSLVIDHDHNTGDVRGLLCYWCNSALGAFGDDIKGLDKARQYLCSAIN